MLAAANNKSTKYIISTVYVWLKFLFNNWWCIWNLSGVDILSPFNNLLIIANTVSHIGIANINNGIIITTGTISDDITSILCKINKPYNIKIISSTELDIPYTEYILKTN